MNNAGCTSSEQFHELNMRHGTEEADTHAAVVSHGPPVGRTFRLQVLSRQKQRCLRHFRPHCIERKEERFRVLQSPPMPNEQEDW